jgi:hypothetical protein
MSMDKQRDKQINKQRGGQTDKVDSLYPQTSFARGIKNSFTSRYYTLI